MRGLYVEIFICFVISAVCQFSAGFRLPPVTSSSGEHYKEIEFISDNFNNFEPEQVYINRALRSYHAEAGIDRETLFPSPKEKKLDSWDFGGPTANSNLNYSLPASEISALRDLYVALHGENWTWSQDGIPWNFITTPCGNPATAQQRWDGIVCTCNAASPEYHIHAFYNEYYYDDTFYLPNDFYQCRVYKIFLSARNLRGTLPATLFTSFHNLTRLHLGFNSITGTLPRNPSPLTPWSKFQLEFMEISFNQLRGSVPAWITNFHKLETLSLQNNSLSSSLPYDLGQQFSRALVNIQFFSNRLTGSVPLSLCNYQSLKSLTLGFNKMQSTVPTCLGSLKELRYLSIRGNQFTGDFPNFLSSLTNLEFLGIGGNPYNPSTISSSLSSLKKLTAFLFYGASLSGTLPSELGTLKFIQIFRVDDNNLKGSVPASLCDIESLVYLRMERNGFNGHLPSCFEKASRLQVFSLSSNKLTGPIPRQLANIRSLESLLLNDNHLSGNLDGLFNPRTQMHLKNIDISENAITGALRSEVFLLPNLTILSTSSNCMAGTIPQMICEATRLESLLLVGLQLSSQCAIPIAEFSVNKLYYRSNVNGASSRGLIGSLPACIFSLPKLSVLSIAGNGISGSLPVSLGISSALANLSLSHNQFTGTIPEAILLRSWQLLDLSTNRFLGTLSPDMTLPLTSELRLSVNRISGEVPRGILHLRAIAILEGNYFSCSHNNLVDNERYLPANDPALSSTQCGSDETNLAIVIFCSMFGLSATLYHFYFSNWKPRNYPLSRGEASTNSVNEESSNVDTACNDESSEARFRKPSNLMFQFPQILCGSRQSSIVSWNLNLYFRWIAGYNETGGMLDFENGSNLAEFFEIVRSFRWICLWLSFILFTIYIPIIYVPLTIYYGGITVQYVWELSAIFFEGEAAGLILFFAFAIFLFLLRFLLASSLPKTLPLEQLTKEHVSSHFLQRDRERELSVFIQKNERLPPFNGTPKMCTLTHTMLHRLSIFGIVLLNTVVVVGVNLAYVFATLNLNSSELAACSFALSLFKIVWPSLLYSISYRTLSYSQNENTPAMRLNRDRRNLTAHVFIALLNTIIIPCIAIILVSPNCTRFAFILPEKVQTTYSVPQCISYSLSLKCSAYTNTFSSLGLIPPFNYNYSCSSTILVSYTPVFIYFFITVSFAFPIIGVFMVLIRRKYVCPEVQSDRLKNTGSQLVLELATVTLTICGPVYEQHNLPAWARLWNRFVGCGSIMQYSWEDESIRFSQFEKIEYLVSLAQILSVMVSFGLLFPPLCFMGLTAVLVKTWITQVLIQQYVSDANRSTSPNRQRCQAIFDEDFNDMRNLYKQMNWWAIPTAAGFGAFQVFDVLGASNGAVNAIWVLIVLSLAIPLVIYVLERVVKNRSVIYTRWVGCLASAASPVAEHHLTTVVQFGMPPTDDNKTGQVLKTDAEIRSSGVVYTAEINIDRDRPGGITESYGSVPSSRNGVEMIAI